MTQPSAQVTDHPDQQQFQLPVDGQTAFIEYRLDGRRLTMTHTEVPEGLEGQGVGSALVRGALDLLRARGQQLVPACPFVAAFVERHPEYADLLSPDQAG